MGPNTVQAMLYVLTEINIGRKQRNLKLWNNLLKRTMNCNNTLFGFILPLELPLELAILSPNLFFLI